MEPIPRPQPDRFGPADRGTRRTWAVVIEATARPDEVPYEFETVRELVTRLADWHAIGLYGADRFAVQLDVQAVDCSEALGIAMAAHRQAAVDIGMAPPLFVRSEVLTPEDMEDDRLESEAGPLPVSAADRVPTRIYDATRTLLRVTTVAEIRSILAQFVTDAGGSVTVGPRRPQPGMVVVDLGLGPNDQTYASAEALSVGGLLIEQSLPTLVDDARRAFQRLGRLPDRR